MLFVCAPFRILLCSALQSSYALAVLTRHDHTRSASTSQCHECGALFTPAYNNNYWSLAFQNHSTITRDAVVEVSVNFNHVGFFNVHLNLGTWASRISVSIKKADGVRILHPTGQQLSAITTRPPWREHPCLCYRVEVWV